MTQAVSSDRAFVSCALCALAWLIGIVAAVPSARAQSPTTQQAQQPHSQQQPRSDQPTTTTAPAAGGTKLNLPVSNEHRTKLDDVLDTGKGPGMWQMAAYMIVLLMLAVGAVFVLKRVAPRIAGSSRREVSVVETVYLAPKRSVHLVQVGDRRFLLGGTHENISMLAEVTKAFGGLLDAESSRAEAPVETEAASDDYGPLTN